MTVPRFALAMDEYLALPGCEMVRPVPRPQDDDTVVVTRNMGSYIIGMAAVAEAMREMTDNLPPVLDAYDTLLALRVQQGNTLHIATGAISASAD